MCCHIFIYVSIFQEVSFPAGKCLMLIIGWVWKTNTWNVLICKIIVFYKFLVTIIEEVNCVCLQNYTYFQVMIYWLFNINNATETGEFKATSSWNTWNCLLNLLKYNIKHISFLFSGKLIFYRLSLVSYGNQTKICFIFCAIKANKIFPILYFRNELRWIVLFKV